MHSLATVRGNHRADNLYNGIELFIRQLTPYRLNIA